MSIPYELATLRMVRRGLPQPPPPAAVFVSSVTHVFFCFVKRALLFDRLGREARHLGDSHPRHRHERLRPVES